MLDQAISRLDAGDYSGAFDLVDSHLYVHPTDHLALYLAGVIEARCGRKGAARQYFERCLEHAEGLEPRKLASIWCNVGSATDVETDLEGARSAYLHALKLTPDDPDVLGNLAVVELKAGRHDYAIAYAEKALGMADNQSARDAMAMACLATGQWAKAWPHWRLERPTEERKYRDFGLPRWEGEAGQHVIVYGEQGLGDEILAASMLPDMLWRNRVILECDKRLEALFRRSFPEAEVYGTRRDDAPHWLPSEATHQIECFGLGEFFRPESAPGTPYLIADPAQRKMWRTALDGLGRGRKVGIAWSGGTHATGAQRRSLSLEDLTPVLETDCQFVSLQYRPAPEIKALRHKGIVIHEFPWATQAPDYDLTASLVAELDLVIAVTTTVVDLAGALGKECWCLVPDVAPWRYGTEGEAHPWYRSVRLFRGMDVAKCASSLS